MPSIQPCIDGTSGRTSQLENQLETKTMSRERSPVVR